MDRSLYTLPMKPVRTAARALILKERKLLTIKMRDDRGVFYILPGGGQRAGETLEEAVQRECLEELGTPVAVKDFLYIREYIGKNHGFAYIHSRFHQLEAVFSCELLHPHALGGGYETDKKQIGWAWLPLDRIRDVSFYPTAILTYFRNGTFVPPSSYLGDIN